MKITFYFDPCCPFCWITSRWLLMVESDRQLKIDWRPFSLTLKNDELGQDDLSDMGRSHLTGHRVLRVIQAAEAHGAKPIDLYTDFGIAFHVAGREYDDELIAEVLAERQLPPELIEAADDTSNDAALQDHITSATDVAGDDIGVPTIVFTDEAGQKTGYFGPVLQDLPEKDEALKLWDGLSQLATSSSFYELKRSRPAGGPDVASTARC